MNLIEKKSLTLICVMTHLDKYDTSMQAKSRVKCVFDFISVRVTYPSLKSLQWDYVDIDLYFSRTVKSQDNRLDRLLRSVRYVTFSV